MACQPFPAYTASPPAGLCYVLGVQVISALVCNCLGLDHSRLNQFRFSAGSISVIEFPSAEDMSRVVVRASMLAGLLPFC